jgi:hypothetical protein
MSAMVGEVTLLTSRWSFQGPHARGVPALIYRLSIPNGVVTDGSAWNRDKKGVWL